MEVNVKQNYLVCSFAFSRGNKYTQICENKVDKWWQNLKFCKDCKTYSCMFLMLLWINYQYMLFYLCKLESKQYNLLILWNDLVFLFRLHNLLDNVKQQPDQ